MVGYVESLTDPSYKSQILVLTYPLIGNYGVPGSEEDINGLVKYFESNKIHASGLIVAELSPAFSHHLAKKSLEAWLKEQSIPAVFGIDSRMLTKKIREHGSLLGAIVPEGVSSPEFPLPDPNKSNLVAMVSTKKPTTFKQTVNSAEPPLRVALLDVGTKFSQVRCLTDRNCAVTVLPWDHSLTSNELSNYNGLFLSNGPGDPTMVAQTVSNLKSLLSTTSIPIFGICLGHQLLSLAAGASTYKMKFGHRGHNQPCLQPETGRCFITSQNHGYAVSNDNLPTGWHTLFVNANDNTNEGIVHESKPFFSVQFHPEHNAGPADLECLFDVFVEYMRKAASNKESLAPIRSEILKCLSPVPSYQANVSKVKKVVLLGSGGLSIGQVLALYSFLFAFHIYS